MDFILSIYFVSLLVNLLNSSKQGLHTHARPCTLAHARPCVSCFVLVRWLASLCQRLLNPTLLQTGK